MLALPHARLHARRTRDMARLRAPIVRALLAALFAARRVALVVLRAREAALVLAVEHALAWMRAVAGARDLAGRYGGFRALDGNLLAVAADGLARARAARENAAARLDAVECPRILVARHDSGVLAVWELLPDLLVAQDRPQILELVASGKHEHTLSWVPTV